MLVIPKPLGGVDVADLEELVRNQVSESRTLEYKRDLPGHAESTTIPFLAEVSAFANTSGGDLIFGIDESGGLPTAILGVQTDDIDREILRLEGMMRSGLEPRLPPHETKVLGIGDRRFVVIMRIPRSWFPPHRVSYRDHSKFYGRSANGKYPLDVSELRAAFTLSEQLAERMRRFRADRLIAITGAEAPIRLEHTGTLVLHLLPISSFGAGVTVDLLQFLRDWSLLSPIEHFGSSRRLTFDGFLVYAGAAGQEVRGYTLLFRNGILEATMVLGWDGKKTIPSVAYEQYLREALPKYLKVLSTLGIGLPVYLTIALVGVKGYVLWTGERIIQHDPVVLDRDLLDLPEVVLDSLDVQPDVALRSSFDLIWNAFNFPASMNYDEKGNWRGSR